MASDERPLRLLSLDGGGIRGLSIIYILQDVMRRVNLRRSKDERLEPWQYFDMIGGTSTGGIIALMLGRLKMSLEECERAYLDLSREIFTPRKQSYPFIGRGVDLVNAYGKFDAKVLENAIKKIIEARSTSPEVELLSNPEPECKVFVCAIQSSQHDTTPALLRTYKNDSVADLISKKFKLWEACRATSAASTFFDPLVIHDGPISSYFLDGGLMLNNPVNTVFKEAQEVWGRERRMSLISVGAGDAPSGQFHGNIKNVVQGLAKIATDSRTAAEQFYSTQLGHPQLAGNYFRLNVSGMATIGLEEHKLCGEIEHATQYYLQSGETKTKLEQCIKELLEPERQEYDRG
ncbi:hypothetical protein BFW01_g951 [Lasiodiplodia theobromae]|uniref:PNPLA domain-containing protein n=1 Tax=Lasiodiplodia theobromae TaxID=45133 RepID=A0A8H7IQY1_9PEZI|nr:hypothetical protein BFW01_g951 [Lasiodiplodia theobromae]